MLQHLSVGRGRDPSTLACSTRETSASSSMVPWSLCYGVNMGEKLSLSADHAFLTILKIPLFNFWHFFLSQATL